ncbi:pentapeptide repeat-containing protein (plasmid) [Kovacikia minuta CCNUW1]|uniref:pentapeptide repeat-containing protein n=1 Tax=Kovacikia minuta TaxID=2931930 RepID=UPI001CC9CDDC|nr:pentapeptide repeat-containing protein [Kovacikia minuta]UBF30094.1 pentapeptide repeat-containing protein [Kovacikia minuta CCNUW1]
MSNDPSQQTPPNVPGSLLDGSVPPATTGGVSASPDGGGQIPPPDASASVATKGVSGGAKPELPPPLTEQAVKAKVQQIRMQRLRKAEKPTPEEDWERAIYELQLTRWQKFCQWTGLGEKNGWDVAQLLTVPIMLALVTAGLGEYAKSREQQQQKADKEKAQTLADDKAKQDTLVKYLDQMAGSFKDGLLKAKYGDDKFIVAQSRTVLVLQSLDRKRQQLVIQFLNASDLKQVGDDEDTKKFLEKLDPSNRHKLPKNVRLGLLYQAQMVKANLANSDLSGATLIRANLEGANLGCNPLDTKELEHCSDLSWIDFRGAKLIRANLNGADLSRADLSRADLQNANLNGADFSGANLQGAWFDRANLRNAILLRTDLASAKELTLKQLTGKDAPLLCNVRFPDYITGIDSYRDCDRIAQEFVKLDPKTFPDLQSAQNDVNEWRQWKFD